MFLSIENEAYINCVLITVCIILAMFSVGCCAETTTVVKSIQCSESFINAPWHEYKGKPDIQLSLTTKGMREYGKDAELRQTKINIEAICSSEYLNRSEYWTYMWPPGAKITCKKGESLFVSMLEPNDPDKDRYHYIGALTIVRDEINDE